MTKRKTIVKSNIKLSTDRLVRRTIKQLEKALRHPSTEPVNEVVKAKKICGNYHARYTTSVVEAEDLGNWILETATQAWDKFKLWKKMGNEVYIPIDLDYRKRKHVKIIIDEALAGTF